MHTFRGEILLRARFADLIPLILVSLRIYVRVERIQTQSRFLDRTAEREAGWRQPPRHDAKHESSDIFRMLDTKYLHCWDVLYNCFATVSFVSPACLRHIATISHHPPLLGMMLLLMLLLLFFLNRFRWGFW